MAVKYWTGRPTTYEFDYDTGSHSPVAGEVINVDVAAGEFATIRAWTNTDGWAGAGYGKMWVDTCSADFITNLENNDNIDDSGDTQICITTGGVTVKTGDWQVAGNWGVGEGVAVPVADDEVIFDARSSVVPTGGMLDSESGATAQCTFDLLHFKEGWTQGVASATEPLCCSPDKIIIDGTGTYYILCGKDNQSTDTDVDITIIDNKSATVYLYSNANDDANVCKFTDVYVLAGTVYQAYYSEDTDNTGCAVGNLYIIPRHNRSNNVTMTVEKDTFDELNDTAQSIYMNNGTLTIDSRVATFVVRDGIVNYGTDLGASPETDLNITTLRMHSGTFYWYPDDAGNPTITTAWVFGGTFSADGTTNNDRAKTITTLHSFEGAAINVDNMKGNITITNWYNHGATIGMDKGAKVAITYDQP